MAIKTKQPAHKIEIDLDGPGGNAFALLGVAHRLCRDLDLDLDFNKISREMMAGDYENLIQVFDRHFGEYVDLVRS